jgi:hypothetical protein
MRQIVFITGSCCWVQVADSPFASFELLIHDIGKQYHLPGFVIRSTLNSLLKAVKDKTGRNILEASPLARARATAGAVLLGKYALLGRLPHAGCLS